MFDRAKSEKQSVIIEHHSQSISPPPIYLKNGPNPAPHCTDMFCCLLFVAITGGLGYLLVTALLRGNVDTIGAPMDSDGNLCGVEKVVDYPYIFFVTPDERYLYRTVCVETCPTKVTDPSTYALKCYPNSSTNDCKFNPSPTDASQSVQIYNTVPMDNSICKPVNPQFYTAVEPAILVGCVYGAINNIQMAGPIIAAAAGIAFVLALVFTCLLTYLTTFVTWVFLVVYIFFTGLLGAICFLAATNMPIPLLNYRRTGTVTEGYNPVLLAAAVVFGLLFTNALFTVLWRFTKIKFMISVIKLSTEFVGKNKSIIMIPLVAFALLLSLIGVWIMASLYLLSDQHIVANAQIHVTPFQRLIPQPKVSLKIGLSLLGSYWLRTYIVNFAHYLVASTSALWYLTANLHKEEGRWMLWAALKSAVIYHNGSITAGTFFLPLLEPFAAIFNTLFEPISKYRHRSDNVLLHYLARCLLCCCCCCERWVMFINKQAYAEVFMRSESFCTASTSAYYTMHRNKQDFQMLSGLGDSFTHFGKMFLFLVTSFGCWWYMLHIAPFSEIIDKPIYPAIMIGFVALSTSTLFMEMFGQSGDSLLLTYFTDLEVEQTHYGRDECATCPEEIKATVLHLRQKQRKYQG